MTEQNKDWSGNTSIYACNHRTKEDDVAENDLYCTHPESMQLFFEKCAEEAVQDTFCIACVTCGRLQSFSAVLVMAIAGSASKPSNKSIADDAAR